jgi:hypothetical protein
MNALVSDLILALPQERHHPPPLQQYKQKLKATIANAFENAEDRQQASIEDRQGLGHPKETLRVVGRYCARCSSPYVYRGLG